MKTEFSRLPRRGTNVDGHFTIGGVRLGRQVVSVTWALSAIHIKNADRSGRSRVCTVPMPNLPKKGAMLRRGPGWVPCSPERSEVEPICRNHDYIATLNHVAHAHGKLEHGAHTTSQPFENRTRLGSATLLAIACLGGREAERPGCGDGVDHGGRPGPSRRRPG